MRGILPRFSRDFVVATLCVAVALPGPAFALRPAQRESAAGVEELASRFAPQAGTEEKILVYLDPKIKDGRLAGSPEPIREMEVIAASLWKDPRVQGAKRIALAGVPVHNDSRGKAAFSAGRGGGYRTNRAFDPERPFTLLLLMDPVERVPLAAYDLATGEEVYNGEKKSKFISIRR